MSTIDPNEYRKVVCMITDKECKGGNDCSLCKDASEYDHAERMKDRANLLPDTEVIKKGIEFKKNPFNTIAEFRLNAPIKKIIEIFNLPDKTIKHVPYDMRRLVVRWPQFVKMKYILSLGIPHKMIEISSFLIVYYEHKAIIIAPRMTEKEFEENSR